MISIYFSCNNFETVETDNYTIKIPEVEKRTEIGNGTDKYLSKRKKTSYSIIVFKKDKSSFVNENSCIAEELAYFIKGRKYEKIKSEKKNINGVDATIVNGVFYDDTQNNKKVFWNFAVFQSQYYYYVVRIYCDETNYEKNLKISSKIIESFSLKNK